VGVCGLALSGSVWGSVNTVMKLSSFYFYPTDTQLNIPRKMLKFTLKLTLKVLLHVSVSATIIRERGICAQMPRSLMMVI